jgi:hypothetical protein
MKMWFLVHHVSVCLLCMLRNLKAPEWLDTFYSCSLFKSLFILAQHTVNLNTLAPKTVVFQITPKYKIVIFSKTAQVILFKLQ